MIGKDIRNKTHFHAYIIEGAKGSGKHTLALEIAKGLLCRCDESSDIFPCNKCEMCKKISCGYCTDIFFLNRGDKASISVEATRNMLDTIVYYPDDGNYKIYIIEEAEKLTTEAQNALLLSLEEPPEYVVFLLLCTNSTELIDTVRSRSVTVKTEVFSAKTVFDLLRGDANYKRFSDKELQDAATVCRGALGVAKSTLDGTDSDSEIALDAKKTVELLCSKSRADTLLFLSSLKYEREDYAKLFVYVESALGDLLSLKNNCGDLRFYTSSDLCEMTARSVSVSKLYKLYEAVVSSSLDITKYNVSVTATLTSLASLVK